MKRPLTIGVETREVSQDDMKPLVKDLMGAIQVTSVDPDSPNFKAIKVGDIVIKVGPDRTQTFFQFDQAIQFSGKNSPVSMELYREGTRKTVRVSTYDASPQFQGLGHALRVDMCQLSDFRDRIPCLNGRIPAKQ